MDLRCKVFRAGAARELEAQVNAFLEELDVEHEAQLEEISQSEGPHGITITVWYTLLEEQDDSLEEDDLARAPGREEDLSS